MSIRKRVWITRKDERKEAWIVDYTDGQRDRHIRTFQRKKDADEYHAKVKVDIREGIHTAPSKSITLAQAAADWIAYAIAEKRERATIAGYQEMANNHIVPRLGASKIASLTTPRIQKFRDGLLTDLSRDRARKVLAVLKAILKDAKRRGNVAQNVATDVSIQMSGRHRSRLKVGVDIPTREDIRRILEAVPEGRARALLLTAAFTGLRASELRGLRWRDVDLKHQAIHVRQRADRYNAIGSPKSRAGERVVPIGPMVVNGLRQWNVASSQNRPDDLVFATKSGAPDGLSNIVTRIWMPLQVKAGVVGADGKARYSGFHSLRHFYASWCINRRKEGGLELPPKTVQARLGHASIVMTLDRYGHLFPSDDGAELAEAERAIFAT
jgi:integrase